MQMFASYHEAMI